MGHLDFRLAVRGPAASRAALLAYLQARMHVEDGDAAVYLCDAVWGVAVQFPRDYVDGGGQGEPAVRDDGERVVTAWGRCCAASANCHVLALALTAQFEGLTAMLLTEDEAWDLRATHYAAGAAAAVGSFDGREGSQEEDAWVSDMLAQA